MKLYHKMIIAAVAAVITQEVVTEIYGEIKSRIEDNKQEKKHQLWLVAADCADEIITKQIADGTYEWSYDIAAAFDIELERQLWLHNYYEI